MNRRALAAVIDIFGSQMGAYTFHINLQSNFLSIFYIKWIRSPNKILFIDPHFNMINFFLAFYFVQFINVLAKKGKRKLWVDHLGESDRWASPVDHWSKWYFRWWSSLLEHNPNNAGAVIRQKCKLMLNVLFSL